MRFVSQAALCSSDFFFPRSIFWWGEVEDDKNLKALLKTSLWGTHTKKE